MSKISSDVKISRCINTGVLKMSAQPLAQFSSTFERISWSRKDFFQLDARNEDQTEDKLIFSEDLAEDCQSRGYMSNFSDRIKNLEKKISEFQKEDNINNLTKQTLFDHLNNVAMSCFFLDLFNSMLWYRTLEISHLIIQFIT